MRFVAATTRYLQSALRLVAVVLFVSSVGACDQGKPPWQLEARVSRSKYWEYHDRSDEPLCSGLLELLDEHTEAIGGKIGLTVEEDRPLRYYRFRDIEELTLGCPEGAAACAAGDAVLAREPFFAHEQVHTYASRTWGDRAVGLIQEGEAVALSCDPFSRPWAGVPPREALGVGDWRPFLYLNGNSNVGYLAAGYWVTYLAQQFGWQKVGELHRRVLPGLSADDFAIEFARVFPLSMDRAWSAALSGESPPCDNGWSCLATVMSPGEVARPACDGELHRAVEISDQPGVVLTHRWPVFLQDCNDPASHLYEVVPGRVAPTTTWVSLPPGRYRMFGDPTPSAGVTFVAHLPSPFIAGDCDQAGKVTLNHEQSTIVSLLPGTVDGCLRLDGAGRTFTIYLIYVDLPAETSAVVCDGNDAAVACVPLPARGPTTLTIGPGAVFRLQNAKSAPSASHSWGEILFYPSASVDGGA